MLVILSESWIVSWVLFYRAELQRGLKKWVVIRWLRRTHMRDYLVTIFARWSMRYREPMNFGEGSRTSLTFANTFGWVIELSLSEILTWWPAVLSSMMIPYVLRWEKLLKSSYHIGVSSLLFALRAVPWPWPTLFACQHGVTCFCVNDEGVNTSLCLNL